MLLGNLKIFDISLLKTSLGLINLSVKHGNAKANYIVLQCVNFELLLLENYRGGGTHRMGSP